MTDTPPRSPRAALVLGRVRGVPVVVTPSWLIVAFLLAAVYEPVIEHAVPAIGRGVAYLAAVGFAVLFGLCVLAHELGHTLVSLALGHPVQRVVLFALGGVSEMAVEPERARDELLIAGTGPVVSLGLAGGAWLGYDAAPAGTLPTALLGLLCWSNLLLALFNLLPGLPLDGGRLLRAAVCAFGASPVAGTRVAAWAGRCVAVAVAVSGLVADRSSLGLAAGLFSIGLAAFLWLAATQSLRLAELTARLPEVVIADLLRPGMFVSDRLTVAEALTSAWNTNARGLVLLDATQQPAAIVDEVLIGAVPPERRAWTPVSTVARPLEPGMVLSDRLDAAELLRRMQETPAREYLVLHDDGSPAGIIAARDFVRRLLPRGAS